MRHDYDSDSPCYKCGSASDDCICETVAELRSTLQGLAMSLDTAKANMQRINYDDAMAQRALREYGYR